MRGKGAVFTRLLILVAAVAVAAGCSTEVRRLQGANQELVRQRDALTNEIEDLKAQLAAGGMGTADIEARLQKALDDAEHWKAQAEAYEDAYNKSQSLREGISDDVLRRLAAELGGEVIAGGGVRLPSDILFDSGKADLKAAAKEALAAAGDILQGDDARDLFLRIDGHTDNVPIKVSKWKDNMELSQARARAVWVELKGRGVAPTRMFTAGFGEYRPLAENSSSAGRGANRRVEIWIVPPPGSGSGTDASPSMPAGTAMPNKEAQ